MCACVYECVHVYESACVCVFVSNMYICLHYVDLCAAFMETRGTTLMTLLAVADGLYMYLPLHKQM